MKPKMQIRQTLISKISSLFVALPLLFLLACATSGTPTQGPGKYSDSLGLDELEIIKIFSIKSYSKVAVLPIDTSAVPLPDKSDNTYAPVTSMIGRVDQVFQEGFRKGLKDTNLPLESSKSLTSEPGVLIIQAKAFEMNPGSRALRYFVGFGAGKTVAGFQGNVIDARSGQVLLKFKHARASSMGVFGGDYEKFLSDDTRDVGEDIGKMLTKMQ